MNKQRLIQTTHAVLIVFLSTFFICSVGWAATYYVDGTNGSDGNPGTLADPFLTLGKAAASAKAGDQVYVRGGTYRETLEPQHSGTSDNYIVFQNYPNEKVVIDATNKSQGIMLWNDSYIKIKGFEVINSRRAGIHLHHHLDSVDRGSDNNIITGNRVHDCGLDGYSGIYVGGNGNLISNNYSYHNGGGVKDHGIYILGNSNVVEGNTVYSNTRIGIRMEGENNIIRSNIIHDNPEWGISIWVDSPLKAENISIQKNLIYNNGYGGIAIYGSGSGEKPDKVYLFNNTIVNESAKSGLYVVKGAKNVKTKNNIIKGQYSQGFMAVDGESLSGFEEDYNIFHGSGSFLYGTGAYNTLDAYRSASSWGANSLEADPLLDSNYHLQSNSPAIDKGTDVGLPFNGAAPDLGAFETVEETEKILPPKNVRVY